MTRPNINDLLSLPTYKNQPKKLYKELYTMYNNQRSIKSQDRIKVLIEQFKVFRSPEEYPELWV